jgi:hypothetical protein
MLIPHLPDHQCQPQLCTRFLCLFRALPITSASRSCAPGSCACFVLFRSPVPPQSGTRFLRVFYILYFTSAAAAKYQVSNCSLHLCRYSRASSFCAMLSASASRSCAPGSWTLNCTSVSYVCTPGSFSQCGRLSSANEITAFIRYDILYVDCCRWWGRLPR